MINENVFGGVFFLCMLYVFYTQKKTIYERCLTHLCWCYYLLIVKDVCTVSSRLDPSVIVCSLLLYMCLPFCHLLCGCSASGWYSSYQWIWVVATFGVRRRLSKQLLYGYIWCQKRFSKQEVFVCMNTNFINSFKTP
jgi:hypothetical protein